MSITHRTLLMILMSFALFFGFLHLFIPPELLNFQRLHIFLFNLCSGGSVILYYTENQTQPSFKVKAFCLLAILYALLAFFKIYIPAIGIALLLSLIVEVVRIKKFSWFPIGFFRSAEPVYMKFHQASLLCLSIGLAMSGFVILNNEYLKLIEFPKLTLDSFFLGFSFPVSLITMSVMFSLMKKDHRPLTNILQNIGFWAVNLGVITFFIFIIAEVYLPQVIVTGILFAAVVMIFFLFIRLGIQVQQKNFLISGMVFLLFTAVSGIIYILLHFIPEYYTPDIMKFILRIHAFTSLYGWNLSGLTVICRYRDFPILLHSSPVILLHWITALILAPIGCYYPSVAMIAIISYTVLLYVIFSNRRDEERYALMKIR